MRRPCSCILPIVIVGLLEHVPAGDLGLEFGADEEGAAHLAVQRVGLLGRRCQPLPQHHGDQSVDALGGALSAEVKGLRRGEGLAEDHYRVHVGVLHHLGRGNFPCKFFVIIFNREFKSYYTDLLHHYFFFKGTVHINECLHVYITEFANKAFQLQSLAGQKKQHYKEKYKRRGIGQRHQQSNTITKRNKFKFVFIYLGLKPCEELHVPGLVQDALSVSIGCCINDLQK